MRSPGSQLLTNTFDITETGELDVDARAYIQPVRKDGGLQATFRVFPENRRVKSALPACRFGEHRWRDRSQSNSAILVPTQWDLDITKIGTEKFIAGIGDQDDLLFEGVEKSALETSPHSLYARIRHGHYFTGHNGYFCPSDANVIEVHPASAAQVITLGSRPRSQMPVFVGCFGIDHEGYFDKLHSYEYMAGGFSEDGPEYMDTQTPYTR